jgi:hypothetical protein
VLFVWLVPPRARIVVVVAALLLAAPVAASAAPAARRVGVMSIGGPGGAEIEGAIRKALAEQQIRVLGPEELGGAARRAAGSAELRQLAAKLALVAVVAGRVTKQGATYSATVSLHDAARGRVVAKAGWSSRVGRRDLARQVASGLWRRLGPQLRRLGPPAAPAPGGRAPAVAADEAAPVTAATPGGEDDPLGQAPHPSRPQTPAPDATAAEETAGKDGATTADGVPEDVAAEMEREANEEPPGRVSARAPAGGDPAARPARFLLAVGPRLLLRRFSYSDDPDRTLSDYRTSRPVPALAVLMAWMPWVDVPRFGFTLAAEQGAPVSSSHAGAVYDSPHGDYWGAVVLGLSSRFATVDLSAGGGLQRFGFEPRGQAASRPRPVPSVAYRYLRVGLAVELHVGERLGIVAGGCYRHVLHAGDIASADWFPYLTVRGFDGTLGVRYRLWRHLEARAGADLRQYGYLLNTQAGDGKRAYSAMDRYWSGWLGLGLLL